MKTPWPSCVGRLRRQGEQETAALAILRFGPDAAVLQLLREESRLYPRKLSWPFLRNALEIVGAVLVFKYHVPPVVFDAGRYAAANSAVIVYSTALLIQARKCFATVE